MTDFETIVFELVEIAAVKRQRCPQSHEFPKGALSALYLLANKGRIRIETYALNWRVVQILSGPNAGKRTAPCPHNHDGPWRIIDAKGTRYPRQEARWPSAVTASQREGAE